MNNSQISLLIYIVGLLPLMLLGFYFARRKSFTVHKMIMTTVVIANWGLILWVMSPAYRGMASDPNVDFSTIPVILPTIHMALGALSQLMATYLVIMMWTERTPIEKFIPRFKNIKLPMRITLTVWIITVLLGFGIYAVWYGSPSDAGTGGETISTEEAAAPDATEETNDEALGDGSDYDTAPEPATTEAP